MLLGEMIFWGGMLNYFIGAIIMLSGAIQRKKPRFKFGLGFIIGSLVAIAFSLIITAFGT